MCYNAGKMSVKLVELQKDGMQMDETRQKIKKEQLIEIIKIAGWFLLVFVLLLASYSAGWAMRAWANLKMDEFVAQMRTMTGVGKDMVARYLVSCLLPASAYALILTAIVLMLKNMKYKAVMFRRISAVLVLALFVISLGKFWNKLGISEFINNQTASAEFVERHYKNPSEVEIQFPEQKRNLITIFLESMETTYADEASGGAFSYNCIPELTELAMEYEDFSGTDTRLNGGIMMPGSTWTIAALFAQTAGVPFQVSIDGNAMGTQEHFFPGIVCLGDVLETAGYQQVFMIGSEAEFGGRDLYFKDHGNFEILDYNYAIQNRMIPQDYKVSWGYEDKKLFAFAKDKLSKLAADDEPFNFTMLTVDTHFEDGYLCEECGDAFGDDQYSNVMACSSSMIKEFVEWIQQQDFYENTTIVLTGDHLTMDSDYCEGVPGEYARKTYTCFINAAAENEMPETRREYTTMDMFPTIVASLGAEIAGECLGLGTNLFSSRQTLLELYGYSEIYNEVAKKSPMLMAFAEIDETSDAYLKKEGLYPEGEIQSKISEDGTKLLLSVSGITNLEYISRVELDLWESGAEEKDSIPLRITEDGYVLELAIADYADRRIKSAIYAVDGEERRYQIGELSGDFELYENNFIRYLNLLAKKEYTVFMSVRDEAATALNQEALDAMRQLGLQLSLEGEVRSSYYAVVDNGKVIAEQLSKERISQEGILEDEETTYGIMSSGFETGSDCSIKVNGKEYAIGKRGINIVVYDKTSDELIDSVCFDTYSGGAVTRSNGTLQFPILEKAE